MCLDISPSLLSHSNPLGGGCNRSWLPPQPQTLNTSWFRFGYLLQNLLGVTPVIGGTEPTGLPEYYRVRVSTVSFRLYAEYRFRDNDLVPIIQADCALDDCSDESDKSNLSSRMSVSRMKRIRVFTLRPIYCQWLQRAVQ